MDLMSAAIASSQSNTASQVDYAVARKMLDQQKSQGDAMVEMIQAAGHVGAGDPATAAATGLGGSLDTFA
ncbi:MAG TPA: YjfB family protein [Tepidisphaeraceae bacterium]|jgi:hypothetical protein|nr:YjfB family protein [Tepidisphaeraceae bacterium]